VTSSRTRTLKPKTPLAGRGRAKSQTVPNRADVPALNLHPLNRHALALLPKWSLDPDATQLHLLTLASSIGFASQAEAAMLKTMSTAWPPDAVVDYFMRVEGFEDLFLAQKMPLEAVQVILAAVDIVAEPQRFVVPIQ
jgi:hypothetical protein